jgi:hypothetical protein
MAMIRKEVSGSGEALKAVKNAKNASKTAMGGTQRTSFEGSNDPRKSGNPGPNQILKGADGYVNQGDVMMGDVSHSRSFTKTGARGGITGKIAVANEDITSGMGGKFIKKAKG